MVRKFASEGLKERAKFLTKLSRAPRSLLSKKRGPGLYLSFIYIIINLKNLIYFSFKFLI